MKQKIKYRQNEVGDEATFLADIEAGLAESAAGEMIDAVCAHAYFRSLLTDNPQPMPEPIVQTTY